MLFVIHITRASRVIRVIHLQYIADVLDSAAAQSVVWHKSVKISCLVTGTLASLTPLCMACFYSVFSIFLTIALNIFFIFFGL